MATWSKQPVPSALPSRIDWLIGTVIFPDPIRDLSGMARLPGVTSITAGVAWNPTCFFVNGQPTERIWNYDPGGSCGTNPWPRLSYYMGLGQKQTIIDEDADRVSSCKKGDLAAFEQLVRKYEKKMFNIAFRIAGNYEDAGEIVQDAFVSAYRGMGSFRGAAKFSTWLTSITVNLAKNRLKQVRGIRRHEQFSVDDPLPTVDGGLRPDPPSTDPPVHELLEKRDVQLKVQHCINTLEPDFKEVLVLRDLQDFSYEEISAILKVQTGTVKSRLFRAREALKDCLKRAMGEL